MKRKHILFFLTLSTLYFLLTTPLLAADIGKLELAIPTPDPVQAGEKLTLQVIVLNLGTEKWDANSYFLEAEIYDAEKKYLIKTDRLIGTETVTPGQTVLLYVPFKVPTSYGGNYFFRVGLTRFEQKIIYADFLPFMVIPLAILPKKPPAMKFGGNSIFSYRNGSKDDWQEYMGNLSLNVLGQVYERAVSLNIYTYHTPEKKFDLYNFILNYYGENLNLSAGDILPTFSSLSLIGSGLRGAWVTGKISQFTLSSVLARSAKAVEGTATSNGTYTRYLLGGQSKMNLPLGNSNLSVHLVSSYDDKNSISNTGPSLTPVKNIVYGLDTSMEIVPSLTLLGEYSRSNYWSDSEVETSKTVDDAYKFGISFNYKTLSLGSNWQRTNPDFFSLGSQTAIKDRISLDFISGYNITNFGSVGLSYTRYRDNIKNVPGKVTTNQRILSSGVQFSRGSLPIINFGYSLNQVTGEPRTALNNQTETLTLGSSYSFAWIGLTISGQVSNFKDKTGNSHDLQTRTVNSGLNTNFKDMLIVNLGLTLSGVKDIFDSSVNKSNTYSITLRYKVIPEKLSLATWTNLSTRKDNDTSNPGETTNINTNLEIIYYLTQGVGLTLDTGWEKYEDKIKPTENTSGINFQSRLSLSF